MTKTSPYVWKRVEPTPAERGAELEEQGRIDTRNARMLTLQTLAGCALSCVTGVALVAWSVHTSDPGWGKIAFWTGLLLGDGGMMALLLRHSSRTRET